MAEVTYTKKDDKVVTVKKTVEEETERTLEDNANDQAAVQAHLDRLKAEETAIKNALK